MSKGGKKLIKALKAALKFQREYGATVDAQISDLKALGCEGPFHVRETETGFVVSTRAPDQPVN